MANKSIPFTLDTQEGYREGGWIYNLNNNKNDDAGDSLGMGSLSDYPAFEQMQESLRSMVINATVKNKPVSLDFDPRNCQTDNGSLNCTQACLDGKFLFKPTNLRPCVMLAAAALLQKNGTINLDFSDTETAETIKALNIPDFETFPAAGVLRNVTRCLSSSCAATNLGNCSERMYTLGSFPVNVSRLHTISDIFGDYCKRMNPEINGDIAGPGVVLSYFFQAILALFFYFIVNFCTTWMQRYCYAVGGCIKSSLRARAKRLQSRLATSRFGAATASSLAEFQEVQIYLVGSIQVATLISFSSKNTSTGLENNSSFAAAIINARVAPSLSIMSVAPVLLIQCCLQRNGMHWWYTFLTMTAVFIMALAIFAKRDHLLPDADSLWLSFKGQVQLATCGENPSPMVLCRAKKSHYPFENSTLYFAGWLVSSFGSLAWGGLLLDQVVTSLKTRFPNFYSDMVRKRLSRFEGRRSRAFFRRFVQGYWFVIEVMLIIYTIMYLNLLVMIVPNSDMSDSAKWGFGQLIAVLVWTPTIAKYIYFNAFGIKEGFEERLAKSYSITKKPDETPEQEVDAKTGPDDESGLLGSEEPEMARRTW